MTGTDGIDTDALRVVMRLFAEFAQAQSDLSEDASASQELWLSAGLVAAHYERLNELAQSLSMTVPDLLQLLLNDAAEWVRQRVEAADQVYRSGPFEINVRHNTITIDGVEFTGVTPMEFDFLLALVKADGRTCNRVWVLEHVWGSSHYDRSTLTVHVNRLRGKLEAQGFSRALILTVKGFGYKCALKAGFSLE